MTFNEILEMKEIPLKILATDIVHWEQWEGNMQVIHLTYQLQ